MKLMEMGAGGNVFDQFFFKWSFELGSVFILKLHS